jgi:2-polyprenyl-3-methyl-5-hydroxy-6-metoxy-1,4-benzoquinol methylase
VFARRIDNANFRPSIDDFEPAYCQYLAESPVDTSNLGEIIDWIESYVPLTSPALRLLEVGAGSGKLIRRLKRDRACAVSGLEPSEALFRAFDLGSLGVKPINLPELAASGPAPFDVVTVLDVIEHVPEAAEFVEALGAVTRPGALVFLSTPDVRGIPARLLGRRWHHYNAYHFSLYGPQSIAEAARRGGFRTLSIEHRAKRMALAYLWSRALDFQLAGGETSKWSPAGHLSIPVNLRDILSVVWQRI